MLIKSLVNSREVRSLSLNFRVQEFYSLLNNRKTLGILMFSYNLQPKDRQEDLEEFNKREVQANKVVRNVLKFLFFNRKWNEIKNLFQGGVVLIKDKKNREMTKENIKQMLLKKKFFFRLFFWRGNLTRAFLMKVWLGYLNTENLWLKHNANLKFKGNLLLKLKKNA